MNELRRVLLPRPRQVYSGPGSQIADLQDDWKSKMDDDDDGKQ